MFSHKYKEIASWKSTRDAKLTIGKWPFAQISAAWLTQAAERTARVLTG
jgi:hypothetical protein